MPKTIAWIKDIEQADFNIVGKQAEKLNEMHRAGIPLLHGFVITTAAYFTFLRTNHLPEKINDLLSTASYDHADSLQQVASHIRKLISQTKLSDDLVKEIYARYTKLGSLFSQASVSVIPSPTGESEQTPAALAVQGEANLLLKIPEVWADMFRPEILSFRNKHHLDHFATGMAIIVQKNIKSDLAPRSQKLSTKQEHSLVQIEKKLADLFGSPQKVAWALEKDKLYVVKTSPEPEKKSQTQPSDHSQLLLAGHPIAPGIVTGRLRIVSTKKDFDTIVSGDVVFASQPDLPSLSNTRKPAAIIAAPSASTPLSTKQILRQTLKHLGIPAIIATKQPDKTFRDGLIVTVNGTKGEVYRSALHHNIEAGVEKPTMTATKIFVAVSDRNDLSVLHKQTVEGIEFLGTEAIIKQIDVHPHHLLMSGKKNRIMNELIAQLIVTCKLAAPYPVLYKLADLQSHEYHNLSDDQQREMHEMNPALGYHGTFRALRDPLLQLELEVIKHVREEKNLQNLQILLPFVRTVQELQDIKEALRKQKLHRSSTCKIWLSIDTPANVISLEKFVTTGIDGVSINLEHLTMLTLGIDKHNHSVAHLFDEQDPALLWSIETVIKTAGKHHIPSSIRFTSPFVRHSLIEKVVSLGITNISVTPTIVEATRQAVSETERKLLRGQVSIKI